jgi:uncharacterized protein (TIGR04255 family)
MNMVRPKFIDPPIVEQAITIIFERISGFGIGHFGLFWSEIQSKFPHCDAAQRLATQTEVFEPAELGGFEFSVSPIDTPRVMFRNDDGELIQLQDDRFSFNWAKQNGISYPHADATVARFLELYGIFEGFLKRKGLASPSIRQCEVTNLNIIPVTDFGTTYADIGSALNVDPLDLGEEFLIADTYVRNRQHRIMSEGKSVGRLHTSISPVVNAQDGSQACRLELTARSAPNIADLTDAREFFDLARSSINAGFLGIVTEKMRKKWREIDA